MINARVKTKVLHMIVALAGLGLASCSNQIEFEQEDVGVSQTRSDVVPDDDSRGNIMSRQEAVVNAANFLKLKTYICKTPYTVYDIHNQSNNDSGSSTLAYLVDFGEENGYAVIANNSKIWSVIAEKYHGKSILKQDLIDEEFIYTLESDINQQSLKTANAKDRMASAYIEDHWLRLPFIETEVNELHPFNSIVDRYYPGCKPGTVATACAVALSYGVDNLRYKGYFYNFPSINYCLVQGEGFSPSLPDMPFASDTDQYFIYSYDGSVQAMSQLIYNFGNEINTNYRKDNSAANIADAYNALGRLGVEMSSFHSSYDYTEFLQVLLEYDMIVATFKDRASGLEICGIVEGGEIICHGSDPLTVSSAMLLLYRVDKNYNRMPNKYDYVKINRDIPEYNEFSCIKYFGVMRK